MNTRKKKIPKYLFPTLILICVLFLFFTFPHITNNYYENKIKSHLKSQTHKDITYFNKYNNYYIINTDKDLIAYDHKYQEILTESLDKVASLDYDIIYKSGSFMYEQTITKKNKIIYNYYDIHTKEKISTIEIEV